MTNPLGLNIPQANGHAVQEASPGLFSHDLVSTRVSEDLPTGYKLRALRKTDYDNGFLDCLRVLTTVGDIAQPQFDAQFDFMARPDSGYYIIVVENETGRVVATGALIVERKFVHKLGAVGHIEDIAVAKDQQGKKLGLRLIQSLDYISEQVGCYKTILDCSEANEGFYVKCGFRKAGLQMAHYFDGGKSKGQ